MKQMPFIVLAQPTLTEKIIGFMDILTPLRMAILLWNQWKALLKTFQAAPADNLKSDTQIELYRVQQEFYRKVISIFQFEAFIKVAMFLSPTVPSFIEEISMMKA